MLALVRMINSNFRGKKGLSNLIAYVLLIVISLSLSIIVYSWLKFQVTPSDVVECPQNTNLVIDSYECYEGENFTVSVKNRGLFNVDGYVLRINPREGSEFGIYVLESSGQILTPGEKNTLVYTLPFEDALNFEGVLVDTVALADVQPRLSVDGKVVSCDAFVSQEITCK